jgi:hypothetical protein
VISASPLPPDEHDLVADLSCARADIDHEMIHRDRSGDRVTRPANQDLSPRCDNSRGTPSA